jgi:hypothetical protein
LDRQSTNAFAQRGVWKNNQSVEQRVGTGDQTLSVACSRFNPVFDRQRSSPVMSALVAAFALTLSSVATVKLPGGVLEVPAGCKAPAEIPMAIDAFIGNIVCNRGRTKITALGAAGQKGPCSSPEGVELKSRHGATLRLCTTSRVDGITKRRVETMMVDLGVGFLEVDVANSEDSVMLLRIASSFRLDREQ